MKERFGSILGFILSLVGLALCMLPLYVINPPWWVWLIWIFVFFALPTISDLLDVGLWIWGLVVVINSPQTWFSIVYYIAMGFGVILSLFNFISAIVSVRNRY